MTCVTLDADAVGLTTTITRQAAEELQLRAGDRVTAAFKATEVMLQKL